MICVQAEGGIWEEGQVEGEGVICVQAEGGMWEEGQVEGEGVQVC